VETLEHLDTDDEPNPVVDVVDLQPMKLASPILLACVGDASAAFRTRCSLIVGRLLWCIGQETVAVGLTTNTGRESI